MTGRRRFLNVGGGRPPIDITSIADQYPSSSSSSYSAPFDFDRMMEKLQELSQLPPVAVAAHISPDVARALEARRDASATHLSPDRPSTTFMGLVIHEREDWPPGQIHFLMSDGSWRKVGG